LILNFLLLIISGQLIYQNLLFSTNIGEVFASVEMFLEPYVVASAMINTGAIAAFIGWTVMIEGLITIGGAIGIVASIAGVLTLLGGVLILLLGLDIISDRLRNYFNLPDWFDLFPLFNFFPPHGNQ
jgi:hypothetical protein